MKPDGMKEREEEGKEEERRRKVERGDLSNLIQVK